MSLQTSFEEKERAIVDSVESSSSPLSLFQICNVHLLSKPVMAIDMTCNIKESECKKT